MQNILVDENNKRIYNYEDNLVKYFNTQNINFNKNNKGIYYYSNYVALMIQYF